NSLKFECSRCKHKCQPGKIWPKPPREVFLVSEYEIEESLKKWKEKREKIHAKKTAKVQKATKLRKKSKTKIVQEKKIENPPSNESNVQDLNLPSELLICIFSYLDQIHLKRCQRVSKRWFNLAGDGYLWEARETICFHSKSTFEEDVIGFGISIERNRMNQIQFISSKLDFIGYEAFYNEKVRKGVYKDEFTHFLPLYINLNHAKRAAPHLATTLKQLYPDTRESKFKPDCAVDFLSKVLKSMVVEVMKGNVHASVKYLEGYMHFHRWLIWFMEKSPNLLKKVNDKVKAFIEDPEARHK